jgi:hypothetical protein
MQARSVLPETEDEATARYETIADDVTAVAMDESEAPLFSGPAGREATGLLLAAVAWHESGYRRDVDQCEGHLARGDHGHSVGLLQIFSGPNYEGHTAKEICEDRRLAIRLGLHVLRRAKDACSRGGPSAWLRGYASGSCTAGYASARQVCNAFESIASKTMRGLSCSSAGPVTLRESTGS